MREVKVRLSESPPLDLAVSPAAEGRFLYRVQGPAGSQEFLSKTPPGEEDFLEWGRKLRGALVGLLGDWGRATELTEGAAGALRECVRGEAPKEPEAAKPTVTTEPPPVAPEPQRRVSAPEPLPPPALGRGDTVLHRVVGYFNRLYGPLGAAASEEFMLSLACLHLQRRPELRGLGRLRKHVMLYWPPGWLKSTILLTMLDLVPESLKARVATSVSDPALRGSVSQGQFYPPEIKVCDVLAVPELSSMLNFKDIELVGSLLSALEEGVVRVSLVKFAELGEEALQGASKYGIQIEDGRISYKTDACFWVGTHTVENLPYAHRQAFLERFSIVTVPRSLLTTELAAQLRSKRRGADEELRLKAELESFFGNGFHVPEPGEVHGLVDRVSRGVPGLNPRTQYELFKTALGYAAYGVTDVEGRLRARLQSAFQAQKTSLDLVADALEAPKTLPELMEATGLSRATVFRCLQRLPCETSREMGPDGQPVTRYRLP